MNKRYLSILVIAGSTLWAAGALAAEDGEWHSLFNGNDLSGWTVKINKHPLGENYADTFRVEDGVIKVAYDRYGKFDEQFGHLYSNQAYSNYILRLEYRSPAPRSPIRRPGPSSTAA